MATAQQQSQYDVLWLTTATNPLLPYSTIASQNKSLATTNKQVIKAINEVLKNNQITQASLDSFITNFNTFITLVGDTYADSSLLPKLQAVGENVILAVDALSQTMKSLDTTIQGKADTAELEGINSVIDDLTESLDNINTAIANGSLGSGGGGEPMGTLIKQFADASEKPYVIIPIPEGKYVDDEKVNVYQYASKSFNITKDLFSSGNYTDEQKANFTITGTNYVLNKTKVTGDYLLKGNTDFVVELVNETTVVTSSGGTTYGGSNVFPVFSLDSGATWNMLEASTGKVVPIDENNLADVKARSVTFANLNNNMAKIVNYVKQGVPLRFGWVFDYTATTSNCSTFKYIFTINQSIYTFIPRTQNSGTTLTTNYTIVKDGNNIIIIVTTAGKYYVEIFV